MPSGSAGELVAPQPVEPVRQYSFTNWQVNNPTAPPPGDRLDAEFDRANTAIGDTLDWAATSLNTDGTLRSGSVGKAQMVSGLFDDIATDIIAEVQPLVDEAQVHAASAFNSATAAGNSANMAGYSATNALQSASASASSANEARAFAAATGDNARSADADADRAENAANHADGSEAVAQAYADVGMAWAEHMPDTIPPNILAVMAVTGDHWSSRWWSHKTAEDGIKLIVAMQRFYLGAFPIPPTTDNQGNPIAVGAMYFDLTLGAMYVWNGTSWQPISAFSPAEIHKFIYVATAGQTVFAGPDRAGMVLKFDPNFDQTVSVFENGVLRTPDDDYTLTMDTVTMLTPGQAGDIVQIWVESIPITQLEWRTARVDTTAWVFNGTQDTFALKDPDMNTLILASATDLMLSVDGVWQQAGVDYTVASSFVTFNPAPTDDVKCFGIAIVPVPNATAAPQPGLTGVDTSGWVFDGVEVNFPLRDMTGTAVAPGTPENLLISLNGVWQAAGRDYGVVGSTVTFVVPPEPAAKAFGVLGLPAFGGLNSLADDPLSDPSDVA